MDNTLVNIERAINRMQYCINTANPDAEKTKYEYRKAYAKYYESVMEQDTEGCGIHVNAYIKKEAWRRYAEARGYEI